MPSHYPLGGWPPLPPEVRVARYRQVLAWREPPAGQPPATYRAMGARLGLTRERARQLYVKARRWRDEGRL